MYDIHKVLQLSIYLLYKERMVRWLVGLKSLLTSRRLFSHQQRLSSHRVWQTWQFPIISIRKHNSKKIPFSPIPQEIPNDCKLAFLCFAFVAAVLRFSLIVLCRRGESLYWSKKQRQIRRLEGDKEESTCKKVTRASLYILSAPNGYCSRE